MLWRGPVVDVTNDWSDLTILSPQSFHLCHCPITSSPFTHLKLLLGTYMIPRERKGESETLMREKYHLVASHRYSNWGWNMHPRHLSWLGIKPVTFWCIGQCSNQPSHTNWVDWGHIHFWSHLWILVVCGQTTERQGWNPTWEWGLLGQQQRTLAVLSWPFPP